MSHYLLCDRERGKSMYVLYESSRIWVKAIMFSFELHVTIFIKIQTKLELPFALSLLHLRIQCVGCVCSCTQFGYCSQFRWQSLNTLSFGWSLGTGYAVIKYIHYCFCNTLGIFSSYSIFASLSEPQRRKAFGCFCAHILIAREWVELLLHSPGITHEYCYCYCDR